VHLREKQKKKICKRGILKEFFAGGKAKLAYFAGNKYLFTLFFNLKIRPTQFLIKIS
jgi:hypothetical protein